MFIKATMDIKIKYMENSIKDNNINKIEEGKIRNYLDDSYNNAVIFTYDKTDSTNIRAKEYAKEQKAKHNSNTYDIAESRKEVLQGIFVAEEQTGGRGRLGRTFYSPESVGIYMSLLIPADKIQGDIQMITIGTAVAVCHSVKKVCNIDLGIKWVNDLYKNGKKVCGILAEAVNDEDTGKIKNIVIGIGINCTTEEFPDEISDKATSLSKEGIIDRNRLIAEIAEDVADVAGRLSDYSIIEEYRRKSIVYGKEVTYNYKGLEKKGVVKEINDLGNLVVYADDGSVDVLSSGEVSVKGEWT